MKAQHPNKTTMAKRTNTRQSSLNRLLDTEDTSLTLTTRALATEALGKSNRFKLVDIAR
ncbi:MAG: hypothetical protein JXK51_05090 [Halothiobacillaceae bacterium]|nr:hypothetical protein [Halothiobacillaceae bacterium]HQS01790.1 hypothetical protein [Halothiobacillus sp.]HQS28366.1 hypothetical protein [Halothiobacillus sp.]